MNYHHQANSKRIPLRVKRALLIIAALIVSIIMIDKGVEQVSPTSSSPNERGEALPQFLVDESGRGIVPAFEKFEGDASSFAPDALAQAFAIYEQDLLDHFGAAWVSPHEIDSSVTHELFGVSPHQLEALTQTPQLLWNHSKGIQAMELLGWVTQSQSPLTSSLATHSAYLEKQGWTPLASNSETTLSLVKEHSDRGEMSQKSRYSWLLVELVSVGDQTIALYSFQ